MHVHMLLVVTGIHPCTSTLLVAMGYNQQVRRKYRNDGITVTPALAFFCKVTVPARHRHSGIRLCPVPLASDNFGIANA
jgi:hypothetical protein